MKTAEKMLLVVVGLMFFVAFINNGKFALHSDPTGAGLSLGYK